MDYVLFSIHHSLLVSHDTRTHDPHDYKSLFDSPLSYLTDSLSKNPSSRQKPVMSEL